MSWRKRADTDLELSSLFFLVVLTLVRWFHRHSCPSGERPFFGVTFWGEFRKRVSHPKMWLIIFHLSLHYGSKCSLVFFSSRLRANTLSHPSLPVTSGYWQREEYIRFQWFHLCAEDLGPPVFSGHFYYCNHSPVTGWLTMSCFGLTPSEVNWLYCRLSAFSYFSSLLPSPEIFFITLIYRITLMKQYF